jgi:hypothetical protein
MNLFMLTIALLYVGACIYSCIYGKWLYGALYLSWAIGNCVVCALEARG